MAPASDTHQAHGRGTGQTAGRHDELEEDLARTTGVAWAALRSLRLDGLPRTTAAVQAGALPPGPDGVGTAHRLRVEAVIAHDIARRRDDGTDERYRHATQVVGALDDHAAAVRTTGEDDGRRRALAVVRAARAALGPGPERLWADLVLAGATWHAADAAVEAATGAPAQVSLPDAPA